MSVVWQMTYSFDDPPKQDGIANVVVTSLLVGDGNGAIKQIETSKTLNRRDFNNTLISAFFKETNGDPHGKDIRPRGDTIGQLRDG